MSALSHNPAASFVSAPQAEVEARLADAAAVLEQDPARTLELAQSVLERLANPVVAAEASLLVGRAYYQKGHPAEALRPLLEAYALLTAEGAQAAQSLRMLECSLVLGRTYRDLAQFSNAAYWLDEALTLTQGVDSPLEAEALNLLAGVVAEQGEYGRALEYLKNALPIAQRHGLQERQANIFDYIGHIESFLGNYPDALASLKRAYDLLQNVAPGSRSAIANLINLGNLYQVMGQDEQALAFLQRAREVSRAAEDAVMEAAALNNLANLHCDKGQWRAAQTLFEAALELSRSSNNRAYEIDNLDGLGQVQVALGHFEWALKTHSAVLDVARDIGDRGGEMDALLNLGRDYLELGEPGRAAQVLSEGLSLAESLERLKSVYEAHELLSGACEANGDLANALFHQRESHRLERALFNSESEAKTRQLTVQFEVERTRHEAETYRLRTQVAQQARREAEAAVAERTLELEESQLEVVTRLALAAEYRDDITGEHTRRVGRNAAAIAYALGYPDDEVKLLYTAARLHDVGKIGVSDAVLLKPDKLTEGEFELIRYHTVIGARILSDGRSRLLQVAEEIALSHHERYDGQGYPYGLARDAIPEAARIVAVADVLDALTHERPYKEAWSVEKTLAEIARGSGRHFDPRVVAACLRVFGEGKLSPLEPQSLTDTLEALQSVLESEAF